MAASNGCRSRSMARERRSTRHQRDRRRALRALDALPRRSPRSRPSRQCGRWFRLIPGPVVVIASSRGVSGGPKLMQLTRRGGANTVAHADRSDGLAHSALDANPCDATASSTGPGLGEPFALDLREAFEQSADITLSNHGLPEAVAETLAAQDVCQHLLNLGDPCVADS